MIIRNAREDVSRTGSRAYRVETISRNRRYRRRYVTAHGFEHFEILRDRSNEIRTDVSSAPALSIKLSTEQELDVNFTFLFYP